MSLTLNIIHEIAALLAVLAIGMLFGYLLKVMIDNCLSIESKYSIAMIFIKKYWWMLPLSILISTIPVIINLIMLTSTPIEVYNGDWLSFWGAYLGAVVPFIILFLTLNNNKSENEKNRAAQSKYIKCQVDYSRLDNLNATFSKYICALSHMELCFIAFQAKFEPILSRNKIESILIKANEAYQLIDSSLLLFNGKRNKSIVALLSNFQDEYNHVLANLGFIINTYVNGNSCEDFVKTIEKEPYRNNKIMQVIKKGKYNFNENKDDIMYDLVKTLDFDNIENEFKKFIKNEKQEIDKQLNALHKSIITEDSSDSPCF